MGAPIQTVDDRSPLPTGQSRLRRRLSACVYATILTLIISTLPFVFSACTQSDPVDPSGQGRTTITYWQSWTNFEGEANRRVVDAFNKAQDKIYVEFITVSQLDDKLLVAITGQTPPDVSTMLWYSAHRYAEKRALIPLDEMMKEAGLSSDRYLPCIWDMCRIGGQTVCLPQTPATVALHWNKTLFREVGLDTERPPRTIAELDEMAEKLTVVGKNGQYERMGFLHVEPGWWRWSWGYYFGGQIWNGSDRFTVDSPENIEAYRWLVSYPERYGRERVEAFRGGFGNFDSAENAFMSGRLAMVVQGVWMANFISRHKPDLDYGVAPFPTSDPSLPPPTYVEGDVIAIPRGSKHPKEAFEFIRWTQRQEMLELLAFGQKKFSPLKETTPGFFENHPNPNIDVFVELARSPNWFSTPKTVLNTLMMDEMQTAEESIWLGMQSPEDALQWVQDRLQPQLDRARANAPDTGD